MFCYSAWRMRFYSSTNLEVADSELCFVCQTGIDWKLTICYDQSELPAKSYMKELEVPNRQTKAVSHEASKVSKTYEYEDWPYDIAQDQIDWVSHFSSRLPGDVTRSPANKASVSIKDHVTVYLTSTSNNSRNIVRKEFSKGKTKYSAAPNEMDSGAQQCQFELYWQNNNKSNRDHWGSAKESENQRK